MTNKTAAFPIETRPHEVSGKVERYFNSTIFFVAVKSSVVNR
jgi:hypothetical protein